MKRVDGPGHVANRFSDGNPAVGQQATIPGESWFNAVQEEIARAVELAGIALNPENNEQLYAAMLAIAAGAAGAGGGSVPTTRQVLAAGLATGGGDLVADRTITVTKASAAEVLAGVNDAKAVTPLALTSAFARSLTASGYLTVPFGGGMIIQWIASTVATNTTTNLSWPVAFPTECWGAVCNGGRSALDSSDNPPFVSGVGTTTVSIFNDINATTSVFVIGLGR